MSALEQEKLCNRSAAKIIFNFYSKYFRGGLIMQSMCSSDVLLERLGRISHKDHLKHYWVYRGVGIVGYFGNFSFFARGEPK